MQVLNPGASRVVWTPWERVGEAGEALNCAGCDQICLMPGELTELELFQSS